jgi:hypothetical protein
VDFVSQPRALYSRSVTTPFWSVMPSGRPFPSCDVMLIWCPTALVMRER